MQVYKYGLIGFILVLLLGGCASRAISLKLVANVDQSLTYQNNFEILVSEKRFYKIKISPIRELIKSYHPAEFGLVIYNNDIENLNFSTDNIKAYCGKKTIKVFTFEEALEDEEKRMGLSASSLVGLTPSQIATVMASRPYRPDRHEQLKESAAMLLKRQTISPKSLHVGIFKIAFPACGYVDVLTMEVINPKETHKFTFKLQKR